MKRKNILLLTLLLLLYSITGLRAQDGEALFKANCGSCHKVDKKMTGPALMGVHERWDNEMEEMVAFVQNSQAYMGAGRSKSDYAKALFEEYNKVIMPPQALDEEQIKSIFSYIESYVPPEPVAESPAGEPTTVPDDVYLSIVMLVGVLLFVCLLLILVVSILIHALYAKRSGAPITWTGFASMANRFFGSRAVRTLVALIVLFGVFNSLHNVATNVNFNHNYQPVQPIAFSHALHAGQYEIECQYCHVGVEKGKNATIPSTNICMNCHNAIEEGPKYGKEEIAKIYESYENNTPIEWVKVHNLPDLVYFSHAQHVKVAGLECEECHGPIEEMEEVYQFSKLNMGWCVSCHREKEVDINKNDYYRSIHAELREKQEAGEIEKITVEKLGGLECARCHY